jgi:hypothetical protein
LEGRIRVGSRCSVGTSSKKLHFRSGKGVTRHLNVSIPRFLSADGAAYWCFASSQRQSRAC